MHVHVLQCCFALNTNGPKRTVLAFAPIDSDLSCLLEPRVKILFATVPDWLNLEISTTSIPPHLTSLLSISPDACLYLGNSHSNRSLLNWTSSASVAPWSPSVCREGGQGQEVVKAARVVKVRALINKRRWIWATSGVLGEELILADELRLMDFLPATEMWVTAAGRWGWGLQTALSRGGFRQEPIADKTLGMENRNITFFELKNSIKGVATG